MTLGEEEGVEKECRTQRLRELGCVTRREKKKGSKREAEREAEKEVTGSGEKKKERNR